jgi:hypothetical protein
MAKKGQGPKGRGRKRKRPVGDLTAKRGHVQGGAETPAGKLTFGAPSPRPVAEDPDNHG